MRISDQTSPTLYFGAGAILSTALDLANNGVAPLQSTHQELALANAQNLSQYIALGFYGVPGRKPKFRH